MLLVALSPAYDPSNVAENDISIKMFGVILASLSSGGGELSFLGLTHFYGHFSLAAWSSGTGAAGLVGAGAYALATTSFGLSVRTTLLASACLPAVMIVSFFAVLPLGPLRKAEKTGEGYQPVLDEVDDDGSIDYNTTNERGLGSEFRDDTAENEGLLGNDPENHVKTVSPENGGLSWKQFKANLKRAKSLFFPL